ncbi:hypothetical protein MSAN_01730600 [Mycena sanguinolenta]|uniref:Uncharacterized protein n=1 Tax=Mycena sanguinolenta TaxID=230812 RepID=A0A8H7CV58_9AGAR|nr:hypothetical protein MSAN_01730600 [Mycena sanguinolenta]
MPTVLELARAPVYFFLKQISVAVLIYCRRSGVAVTSPPALPPYSSVLFSCPPFATTIVGTTPRNQSFGLRHVKPLGILPQQCTKLVVMLTRSRQYRHLRLYLNPPHRPVPAVFFLSFSMAPNSIVHSSSSSSNDSQNPEIDGSTTARISSPVNQIVNQPGSASAMDDVLAFDVTHGSDGMIRPRRPEDPSHSSHGGLRPQDPELSFRPFNLFPLDFFSPPSHSNPSTSSFGGIALAHSNSGNALRADLPSDVPNAFMTVFSAGSANRSSTSPSPPPS